MPSTLILAVTSPDKPGVVEAIAKAVSDQQGNWLESRFSHLSGMFAGIVRIQLEEDSRAALEQSLDQLNEQGIQIAIHHPALLDPERGEQTMSRFHAVGPDRQGIVREISQAFSEANINIEEMNSQLSSMPYSGDPLFEAEGVLSVPHGTDLEAFEEKLVAIADMLGVDFSLQAQTQP